MKQKKNADKVKRPDATVKKIKNKAGIVNTGTKTVSKADTAKTAATDDVQGTEEMSAEGILSNGSNEDEFYGDIIDLDASDFSGSSDVNKSLSENGAAVEKRTPASLADSAFEEVTLKSAGYNVTHEETETDMDEDAYDADSTESDKKVSSSKITKDKKSANEEIEVGGPEAIPASKTLKAFGIVSVCLAVLGLAGIGAIVYFMILNPAYIKEDSSGKFDIPYVNTMTDVIEYTDVTVLATPSDVNLDNIIDIVADIDAHAVDNSANVNTPSDATDTDATNTDATDMGAGAEDNETN